MGRWSRLVARRFVEGLDPQPDQRWLDVGCGTGALTDTVLDLARPSRMVGVDTSADFIQMAGQRLGDRAELHVAGGDDLPFDDGEFDFVVSGLALNFMPDPPRALSEWRRLIGQGGVVSVYVWDYAGRMGFLRAFWDVARSLDPGSHRFDQAERFAICRPDALQSAFEEAGFSDVGTGSVEIETRFVDFDDFWTPFLNGIGPAGTYVGSLDDRQRERLRSSLMATISTGDDGAFEFPARAWTAAGGR